MKKVEIILILILFGNIELFAKDLGACKGCHGQNFEKKAMGMSKIVKNMSKQEIIKAIKGYKDGSYGGAMKALMKGQVAFFSNQDIQETAVQITGDIDTNIEPIHSTSQSKQKSLQVKKVEKQLSILNIELDNLESEKYLLNSQIDIKTKKIVSIQQQAGYDIDTYLEKILSLQKKEIMDSVSFESDISRYKQKARDVKRNTLNEVVRIEQKLKSLKSRLKINVKKLKRYRINKDEKVKLLNYYNSTE